MNTMRKLLFAAAAVSGLALAASTSFAGPLASGLTTANSSMPQMDDGLVQTIHGWHCGRKWSKRLGKHRHRRACDDYDDYDYDDYSYGYGYPSHGYGYPGYGYGALPFFLGFNFDN